MNNQNQKESSFEVIISAISLILIFIGIGILIGHFAWPKIEKEYIYTNEVKIISIIEEEQKCKEAGGNFSINQCWYGDDCAYKITCVKEPEEVFNFKITNQ